MKVLKRCLLGVLFSAAGFVMFFFGAGHTSAADLEQSPDEVSMEIVHEHDDEACSTQVWIPCGGSWTNDHHGSHRIHYCSNQKSDEIVNGHVLADIHGCDWYWGYTTEEYHDGEYVTEFDCDLSTIGIFAIKRTEDEDGIHLTAYTRVTDADLGDYTISWDDGTVGAPNSSVTIDVDRRRTYTASLRWHDVKRNADFTDSLSYTDVSFPCRCKFISEDEVIEERSIRCGDRPEIMDVPVKEGYTFDGYYNEDVQWIDGEGSPTPDFVISRSDYDLTLNAVWSAKTYELKIGDEVLSFIYEEPYDDIDIAGLGLRKQGYEFDGISFDGELIFNEDGSAAGDGIWKWDIPEDAEAEVIWEKLPDPAPVPSEESSAEDDDDDDDDDHHHRVSFDDTESVPEEPAPSTSDAPSVSEDRSEMTVSSDEAVINNDINEDVQEENDDSDNPDMNVISYENSLQSDSPTGDGEKAEVESAGSEPPYIELFNTEKSSSHPEEYVSDPDGGDPRHDVSDDGTEKKPAAIWIKKVMVVAAVTCGVVGGGTAAVYAVYAGFVYLFGMASVINVLPDGKKKNLGKLTVTDRSGGDIEINIPQDFVDNCSTGNIEIVMPEMFVKKRDRKQLVVVVNEKKYLKNIKKNIELKLFA